MNSRKRSLTAAGLALVLSTSIFLLLGLAANGADSPWPAARGPVIKEIEPGPFLAHGRRLHRSSDRVPRVVPPLSGYRRADGSRLDGRPGRQTLLLDRRGDHARARLVAVGAARAARAVSQGGPGRPVGGHRAGLQQHAADERPAVARHGPLASRGLVAAGPAPGGRPERRERRSAGGGDGLARPRRALPVHRHQRRQRRQPVSASLGLLVEDARRPADVRLAEHRLRLGV